MLKGQPNVLTRRQFILGGAATVAATSGLGGYALAIEPYRLLVQRYALRPEGWPQGLNLRVAILADLHACDPWMPVERVEQIVDQTNSLGADLVMLLGDFVASQRMTWHAYDDRLWARALARLSAPLGRHAVLGNHDWWADETAQLARTGLPKVARTLMEAGIPVYENDTVRLAKDGHPFWLSGLGDQWAFYPRWDETPSPRNAGHIGRDDLDLALSKVTDDAPLLMMIHEPDIFAWMPKRVSAAFAGHTHGGQVQLFGYAPVVPSQFGRRYAYGHIEEDSKHMIVSGGLGCSILPVRFGRPPEIVVVDIAA